MLCSTTLALLSATLSQAVVDAGLHFRMAWGSRYWHNVLVFGLPGMAGTFFGAAIAAYLTGIMQLTLFAGDGLAVGILTGLVGVGGGFLIVPALVLLGGMAIHRAVATSLVIIALKSYSDFYKYTDVLENQNVELAWTILLIVTGLGIAGSIVGGKIANCLPQESLKKGFGIFLIVMGLYILIRSAPEALGL